MYHYATEESGVCIQQLATPSALKEPFTTSLLLTWQNPQGFPLFSEIHENNRAEKKTSIHIVGWRMFYEDKRHHFTSMSQAPLNIMVCIEFHLSSAKNQLKNGRD